MKFKWLSKLSRRGFVNAAVIRIDCSGQNIDEAIHQTLNNGNHCTNPELLSDETLLRLRKEVVDRLAVIEREKARREGKRTAG